MGSVLIIDDNPDAAGFVAALARAINCVSVTAEDGLTGLALMKKQHFDVVVLDHHMPGMTGLQLLGRLRVGGALDSPAPPIVLYSADASVKADAIALGAVGFLLKNGDTHGLANIMKKYAGCSDS